MKRTVKRSGVTFYTYIARCRDGTYYTGYTNDLERRLEEHNDGRGAKYLRGKTPIKIVYTKEYKYYKNALNAERRIKKLRREQKEEMVRIYEKRKLFK